MIPPMASRQVPKAFTAHVARPPPPATNVALPIELKDKGKVVEKPKKRQRKRFLDELSREELATLTEKEKVSLAMEGQYIEKVERPKDRARQKVIAATRGSSGASIIPFFFPFSFLFFFIPFSSFLMIVPFLLYPD